MSYTRPSPHRAARLLFGPDGLRAGWALALFFALLYLALSHLPGLLSRVWPPPPGALDTLRRTHELSIGLSLRQTAPALLLLLAVTALLAVLERRSFSVYGLGGTRPVRLVLQGALSGLVAISALVGLLLATHHLVLERVLLHGLPALRSGLRWLFVFALVGLFEEFLLRGFLQYTLARGLGGLARIAGLPHARALGFAAAALLLSLLFGAGHRNNPGESPLGLLTATLAGLLWCFALYRTGSLWWAIGFHTLWDWSESFLFGVPDSGMLSAGRLLDTHPAGPILLSGGLTGPEGSLFVLPVLLLAAVAVRWTLRQQPLPPTQPRARYALEISAATAAHATRPLG